MEIKILGQIFEIEECDFKTGNNDVVFGETDFTKNKILINKNTKEERKAVTVIHEILHCIFTSLRFDTENENETLISSLAESLYLVLKENKSISFLK